MTNLKETYIACRDILKKFIKKNYWHDFSSSDIFYFLNGKKKGLFTFVDQFFEDAYGAQLFFNKEGFNYVHDILTSTKDNTVTLYDCDSLCAVLMDKKDLSTEEISFLHENGFKIKEKDNFILTRFEAGFAPRIANLSEFLIFLEYAEFVCSIVENEYADIMEAFKNKEAVVALMDTEKLQYSVIYRNLPYLEEPYSRKKANIAFALDFKEKSYLDDECYLFTSYLPCVSKTTRIRPIILYFCYKNSKKHVFKYIIDSPKEYKNCIFGILYEVFTTIGLPLKMITNNRVLYACLDKTLSMMNIELDFQNENDAVDENMNEVLSRCYQSATEEEMFDDDLIPLITESITKALNELDYDGYGLEKDTTNDSTLVS